MAFSQIDDGPFCKIIAKRIQSRDKIASQSKYCQIIHTNIGLTALWFN